MVDMPQNPTKPKQLNILVLYKIPNPIYDDKMHWMVRFLFLSLLLGIF